MGGEDSGGVGEASLGEVVEDELALWVEKQGI